MNDFVNFLMFCVCSSLYGIILTLDIFLIRKFSYKIQDGIREMLLFISYILPHVTLPIIGFIHFLCKLEKNNEIKKEQEQLKQKEMELQLRQLERELKE